MEKQQGQFALRFIDPPASVFVGSQNFLSPARRTLYGRAVASYCPFCCDFAFRPRHIAVPANKKEQAQRNLMVRILVIDDDLSVCGIIEKILVSSGYAVTVATCGRAGIAAAVTQSFAAVIVDLCMPDVSGFDAIGVLRAQAPDSRLIVMSGLISEAASGAPDFLGMAKNLHGIPRLAKPFRRDDLLDLVAQCCSESAPAMAKAAAAV
jgi:CheY-like chemotaxis protein